MVCLQPLCLTCPCVWEEADLLIGLQKMTLEDRGEYCRYYVKVRKETQTWKAMGYLSYYEFISILMLRQMSLEFQHLPFITNY